MSKGDNRKEPAWVARFLVALKTGQGVRAAAREAGITSATPYDRRRKNQAFREAWDAIQPVDGRRTKRKGGPRPRREAQRIEQFLHELAETSNVAAAAAIADIPIHRIYRLRRTDPDFARQWYAALAEGYDNLEMELLHHLRSGESPADIAAKRKFDTATALRCLTAHRENVAREKGRRRLADEVATIASINEKIDAMRMQARAGDAAIRKARRTAAKARGNG
ncbi:hypothetical protein [Qipengyuania qiaonensis]|uniref:Terminase n=1 Tax=Qipengyuania qiaonensis TaxID=2867240 RepID=A0ABS7J2C6_9SPHN|nr:hypothetical protein [Qipengyuania qiaonensis]MBX7481480.1 hypothetical protein [Qipengyuania qiaonensis]